MRSAKFAPYCSESCGWSPICLRERCWIWCGTPAMRLPAAKHERCCDAPGKQDYSWRVLNALQQLPVEMKWAAHSSIRPHIHQFIRSFICSFAASLIHWFIGSLIQVDPQVHWVTDSDSLIGSLLHWFIDLLIHWLFDSWVHWLTDSLIMIDPLVHWFLDPLIHRFIDSDSVIHWLVHWFIGSLIWWWLVWLIIWLVGSLTHWLIHWFTDSLTQWLIQWFIESLVHWFTGSLIHWFSDSLIHWFFDSSSHYLTHSLIQMVGCFIDSLIPWFTAWLVHRLIHWFIASFRLADSSIHFSCARFFSCHVIGNSTAMCWFVDAPHNDFDASASQKSSYRPSSSYSGFLFAKLPPLHVPGTAGIPLYHFFCWLNPNSYLFLFQTNSNFSLFNELLQNHGWSQTSPPQLSANCVAWRSQFRNLGVTTRNGARPFLLGKMLVPWPFQSFIWL